MAAKTPSQGDKIGEADAVSELWRPIQATLAELGEPERYRLLAGLLTQLAEQSADGTRRASDKAGDALSKRIQKLEQERAALEDEARVIRADAAHREKQLEAEQARAGELQKVHDTQRARLEAVQKELGDLEAQLVARNNDLHKAESEKEQLLLKLQRTEQAAGDRSGLESRDEANRKLQEEAARLEGERDQLRKDKDDEIASLKAELQQVGAGRGAGTDEMLLKLWERLATTKPPLGEGGIQPNVQAAERLVDAFIEMARYVHEFDQSIRPFLTEYTRHNPSVKVPWGVYADREDFQEIIRQTLAIKGGKHVGGLRMKLRLCRAWAFSAMVASDGVIKSIASELQEHLRGEQGMGADRNLKIVDYLRNDGPDLFMDHMLKLRSEKLAEVYGHGV